MTLLEACAKADGHTTFVYQAGKNRDGSTSWRVRDRAKWLGQMRDWHESPRGKKMVRVWRHRTADNADIKKIQEAQRQIDAAITSLVERRVAQIYGGGKA